MVDKISPSKRSLNMSAIKSTGMKPEMLVRSMVHRMGYRFRLHSKDLPGKPDLVFRSRKKAIFVHGCFWHGHDCRRGARMPKTNTDYWRAKIGRNRARDVRHLEDLAALGWRALVVWECELADETALVARLRVFCGH